VAFDALACMVWIDRYDSQGPRDVSARGAGALCTRHADILVPPRGWAVQDRRGHDLQLWSDRPPTRPTDAPVPVRRARTRAASTTAPTADEPTGRVIVLEPHLPFDAPAGPFDAPAEPEPEVDVAPAPREIDHLLSTPSSPLLSRAFNAAHSRHAG
jgi:hypothetical protein